MCSCCLTVDLNDTNLLHTPIRHPCIFTSVGNLNNFFVVIILAQPGSSSIFELNRLGEFDWSSQTRKNQLDDIFFIFIFETGPTFRSGYIFSVPTSAMTHST